MVSCTNFAGRSLCQKTSNLKGALRIKLALLIKFAEPGLWIWHSVLMAQDDKKKKQAVVFAKLGCVMRDVTGPPPQDLPDEMKELLDKLERDKSIKR